jgi:hypothetical protein
VAVSADCDAADAAAAAESDGLDEKRYSLQLVGMLL